MSVMDYSNIINLNTSHQLLADYLETSRPEINQQAPDKDGPVTKKLPRFKSCTASPAHHASLDQPQALADPDTNDPKLDKPMQMFHLSNYIQKQATLSEQMASLFGKRRATLQ